MATQTQELKKELKKTTADAQKTAKDASKAAKKATAVVTDGVKDTAVSVQRELADTAGDVKDAAQKVFLAGLGAFVVAEEEGSKLFKKLVKKGEKVELPGVGTERVQKIRKQLADTAGDAQGAVKARVEEAAEAVGDTTDKVEDRVQDAVATVMKRLGVPTRTEISELTASVERLTQQIGTLKAETRKATEARAAQPALLMEAVGGGWYEIRVGDIVVEKVQGKEEAEAAVERLQASAN